ncbi:MAG TPA: hemolysin III family protein [Chitinophagales bacterium]
MRKKIRKKEIFWNVATHGFGAALSIVALVLFLYTTYGTGIKLVASSIFGVSLILQYTASSIYHATTTLKQRRFWKRIDHLCIYLLIAGSYTPVVLVGLKGVWGWVIFGIIWSLVLAGFIFKFSRFRWNKKISLSLYVLMGWTCIIAIKPIAETLSEGALTFIVLGGLCYTFGIYFYANDKKPYYHPIWHLFVLGGSVMHFIAVFFYIL